MLRLYGAAPGGLRAALVRRLGVPLAIAWTRFTYRRLARSVARQIEDVLGSGIDVLGVVAVDGSPSCGLHRTLDLRAAVPALARLDPASISVEEMNRLVRGTVAPGTGLFIEALRRALVHRGCQVSFLAHDLLEELEGRRSRVQLPVPPGIPPGGRPLDVEA